MTFNSLGYFLFLPVVYLAFYCTAERWRWLVLLVASYGFYASLKAPYLLAVLLMVTAISYLCGLKIHAACAETVRKRWLWTGSFACVSILALLKYLPFLNFAPEGVPGAGGTLAISVISIGVSYFTFQAISYLADIYLETGEPERHFGRFALYMAFFPKLLQGPIERGGDLLPQLAKPFRFDYQVARSGLLLFSWGLFKKVVVADRLEPFVSTVYEDVHSYQGLPLLIATYFFAAQIYLDFSGYTDMAIGTGRLFGVELSRNFNRPYLATSIADFWRRWHISFSRWILDYIFKPLQLGWRDWGHAGTALALVITFLVSGIWHGASWCFVSWGLLHGLYLALSTYYRPFQKKLHQALGGGKKRWLKWWQVAVTFNMVSFAWIFFRARSIGDALHIVRHLFAGFDQLFLRYADKELWRKQLLLKNGVGKTQLLLALLAILVVHLAESGYAQGMKEKFTGCNVAVRWAYYVTLGISILFFGVFTKQLFIYNRF